MESQAQIIYYDLLPDYTVSVLVKGCDEWDLLKSMSHLESWASSQFTSYELVSITNTTVEQRINWGGCLMTTATNILKSFDEQSVHIDYLCFTFAVKDLRHCHDAVRRLHKHEEYKALPNLDCYSVTVAHLSSLLHLCLIRRLLRHLKKLKRTTKPLISVTETIWKIACASSPTKCLVCHCLRLVV